MFDTECRNKLIYFTNSGAFDSSQHCKYGYVH